MDYKTKPISRNDLRKLAALLRSILNIPDIGSFPVLDILDRLPDYFEHCNYTVEEDSSLPPQRMAQCVPNDQGGFTIEIKETVYNGAYKEQNSVFLGFICHEICHVFLFIIGYKPIYERCFGDRELRPFESVEWQAKALCGELMIPYEESKGLKKKEIVEKYHVSKEMAAYRRRLDVLNK